MDFKTASFRPRYTILSFRYIRSYHIHTRRNLTVPVLSLGWKLFLYFFVIIAHVIALLWYPDICRLIKGNAKKTGYRQSKHCQDHNSYQERQNSKSGRLAFSLPWSQRTSFCISKIYVLIPAASHLLFRRSRSCHCFPVCSRILSGACPLVIPVTFLPVLIQYRLFISLCSLFCVNMTHRFHRRMVILWPV